MHESNSSSFSNDCSAVGSPDEDCVVHSFEDDSPLEILRAMAPNLESAKQLRQVALEIIESGQPVPMRAGKINLAWLAGTVGLTRQVFYEGRGGRDLSQIADLLLEHLRSRPFAKAHTPYDKSLTSLRTEIQLLRTQLRDADRALQGAAFREEIVRSGKILTF
nr:hypothetical protein [Pseudomonas viridiflava]